MVSGDVSRRGAAANYGSLRKITITSPLFEDNDDVQAIEHQSEETSKSEEESHQEEEDYGEEDDESDSSVDNAILFMDRSIEKQPHSINTDRKQSSSKKQQSAFKNLLFMDANNSRQDRLIGQSSATDVNTRGTLDVLTASLAAGDSRQVQQNKAKVSFDASEIPSFTQRAGKQNEEKVVKKGKKVYAKGKAKLRVNVSNCKYEVIREVI
ncbi:hypothetical protein FGO68_gene11758 [Halteria grandinella]|uniref:Uncharacterized protein n=1 Tax=Halteria grandinella TaxID=5974 RepID=A0A8J8SUG1_HALGN|nr:hypothetical protein FGO68_gene11758 [Halteria grandinella]